MPNLSPLAAQTIVIVGAGSGIGLAAAKAAARRGARVFLISRNGPALQAICDDIASDGGVAAFAVADVGDAQALSAAADAAVAAFGPFDSWVHAAGVAIYAPLLETQGAASKVPPPAYSPEVAARAILHAVQHPRREIIVGGVGAFQRAGAILAPGLADRISSLVPPLLRDRRRPANVSNNLDHPRSDGRIRSPSEPSIPFSL